MTAEYLQDPEDEPEEWDEPILANQEQQARRKCQELAKRYTEQNEAPVELVATLPASKSSRKRFICRFRS
ncbi:MAG: hypothetical protein HC857_10255 [Synechococcales cyanobacterium RU_4_20]|nr:hypothetical protein [Synechococcales cyanobacterium RU_4_20]NJR70489.1 hypothetical protein [Synechococcales cyanobacterium CRU_2_2]